jgi:hypothetical protein
MKMLYSSSINEPYKNYMALSLDDKSTQEGRSGIFGAEAELTPYIYHNRLEENIFFHIFIDLRLG